MGTGTLSGDSWFLDQAKGLAASYARHFNTRAGTLVDSKTATGYMRVDWGIEQGGALVRAGVLFNMPRWTTIGKDTLAYIRGHAYVPQYHAYIHIITDMLRADGSANPAPTIFRKSGVNGRPQLTRMLQWVGPVVMVLAITGITLLNTWPASGAHMSPPANVVVISLTPWSLPGRRIEQRPGRDQGTGSLSILHASCAASPPRVPGMNS